MIGNSLTRDIVNLHHHYWMLENSILSTKLPRFYQTFDTEIQHFKKITKYDNFRLGFAFYSHPVKNKSLHYCGHPYSHPSSFVPTICNMKLHKDSLRPNQPVGHNLTLGYRTHSAHHSLLSARKISANPTSA